MYAKTISPLFFPLPSTATLTDNTFIGCPKTDFRRLRNSVGNQTDWRTKFFPKTLTHKKEAEKSKIISWDNSRISYVSQRVVNFPSDLLFRPDSEETEGFFPPDRHLAFTLIREIS